VYFDNRHIAPDVRRLLVPRHLDLLGAALQRLCGRTRTDLARTLAEAAAALVCEAVVAALAAPALPPPVHDRWDRHERRRPILNTFGDPALEEGFSRGWEDDTLEDGAWRDDDTAPRYRRPDRPTVLTAERWSAGLALGLRIAAWWLGRRPGRPALLPALALGAGTTGVAVAGGPMVLTGLRLADAVLGFAAAAEGAARLAATLLSPSDR
jgi:hypothetical protein